MPDQPPDSVPPELQVSLDLELTIKSLRSGAEQQRLDELLKGISGLESVSFFEDKVAIRYNPENITGAEISGRIGSAGFSISGTDSAPPMPSVDFQ